MTYSIVIKTVVATFAISLLGTIACAQASNVNETERVRDTLLVSCLGYTEGRFENPSWVNGQHLTASLYIKAPKQHEKFRFCALKISNDVNHESYNYIVATLNADQSPFYEVKKVQHDDFTTRHFLWKRSQQNIGISLTVKASDETRWIASTFLTSEK